MSIIQQVGTVAANTSAGTSLVCSALNLSNGWDILVAVSIASSSVTVSSVTDTAANTFSQLSALTNSSGVRIELWGAQKIAGNASDVVTVTLNSAALMSVAVQTYSGASQGALAQVGWTCSVTSNVYGTGGSTPNGVVGNGSTVWITNPHPQSITVDMQSAQTFNAIQITPNQSNAIGTAYTLDVSSDGITWITGVESISGLPAVVATQSWSLSTSYTYRYFRVNVTADNGFVSMVTLTLGNTALARNHFANPTSNHNNSNELGDAQNVTHAGDWAVGVFGAVSNSGDTITAVNGTLRQSEVPTVTSSSVAIVDLSSAGVLLINLSSVREWASVGIAIQSDGATIPPVTPQTKPSAIIDAGRGVNHQKILGPTTSTSTPSHFTPVPVASVLQGGVIGTAYSEAITAQGGTSPYVFTVTSGTLPSGLSMSSGGLITGTPLSTGSSTFIVTVTDTNGYTGSQSFTIIITAPVASNYGFVG